jgi:hypothetical protein
MNLANRPTCELPHVLAQVFGFERIADRPCSFQMIESENQGGISIAAAIVTSFPSDVATSTPLIPCGSAPGKSSADGDVDSGSFLPSDVHDSMIRVDRWVTT